MKEFDICIICVPEDKEVADRLANSIKNYKLPKGVVVSDTSLDYRHIYVDSSASTVDDEVKSLLSKSNYLIIICSPRTKPSEAISERIDYFRHELKSDNIIAVIAEGEPIDSFPESFIEKKVVQHIMPDMHIVERLETIEPVAADLRGDTPSKRKQVLQYETVRIIASSLGLHPDALEQRHRRRRNRTIAIIAATISSVFLIMSSIFIYLGIIARNEGIIAQKQAELSYEAANRLVNELPEMFSDDEQALNIINDSISQAQQTLDEIDELYGGEK